MKYSQQLATLAALITSASMLTACANGTASESASSQTSASTTEQTTASTTEQTTASTTEQTSEQPESSAPAETDKLPIVVPAPGGYEVKPSDIATIFGEDGQITPEQITEDNWFSMECNTFCYAAEPTGFNLNSFEGTITEDTEIAEYGDNTYKRVEVGDTICGFTVTSANSSLSQSVGFVGGQITLAESAELTGWARLAPADDGYTMKGDVEFIVDSDSMKLPVMNFKTNESGELVTRLWKCMSDSAVWANEYAQFILGNINNADTDADLSMLYDDGTYTRVKVTLDNITLSCMIDFYSSVTAHIADIEAI